MVELMVEKFSTTTDASLGDLLISQLTRVVTRTYSRRVDYSETMQALVN